MISDLPSDLLEDVLIRLPIKSMRALRSVCKKWNTLSKDLSFAKKSLAQAKAAAEEESKFMVVMVISGQVYLMSTNLHGIHKNQGKLVRLIDSSDQFNISEVYHCDGLLLCTMKGSKKFVVWNPYSCQTRWFSCEQGPGFSMYAIGYDNSKSCRTYKILRFDSSFSFVRYEIYDINSKNIRFFVVISAQWELLSDDRCVSLKGNAYWIAKETLIGNSYFLLCFDFTTERFGSLALPYRSVENIWTLSTVRDEQLAVLFQRNIINTSYMEIWITTKIDPNFVSWRRLFIAVVMEPLRYTRSFFVDEEKKLAVVFDCDLKIGSIGSYIIREDGYFEEVDFEKPLDQLLGYPSMCSYVPSLVQIKRPLNNEATNVKN